MSRRGGMPRRRAWPGLVVAGLLLSPGAAAAHAFLKRSSPVVGSTVRQAPREVAIDFTEGVEPRFSSITVQDASGAVVDAGGVHLEGGGTRLAVGLRPLESGTYSVTWRVVATDTHKTQGRFSFTVRP